MNIHEQTPELILFAGDWHGNLYEAQTVLYQAEKERATHIIQLGDFGIWAGDTDFLNTLQSDLARLNIQLYFVDGNHENFPRLYAHPLAPDGTRTVRPNIHHLPRGLRFTWGNINFLAMGGAYSIDRKFRTLNRDYWEEELITPADIEAAGIAQTDILLSHDSPYGAPNPVTDNPISQISAARFYGEDHLDASTNHRHTLKQVTDATDPAIIFHGHYHSHQSATYTRPETNTHCTVFSLNEGGNYSNLRRHTFYCTLDDLRHMTNYNRRDTTQ